jgi:hypothetical protein
MIYFKDKKNGIEIVEKVINKNITHTNYQRTIDLANDYRTAITGEGFEKWLYQFSKRETKEDFETRKLLTSKVFIPAISNVLNKFNKLTAIKNVTKSINFVTGEKRKEKIELIVDSEQTMLNTSFEDFVRQFLLPRSHRDPNAFYTMLFEKKNDVKVPYLKFFSAEECVYYDFDKNNDIDFLVTKETINTKKTNGDEFQAKDYTLFGGELVLKYKLILLGTDADKENKSKFVREGYSLDAKNYIDDNKNVYEVTEYNTMAKNVQAFRIGYVLDALTDEATCVSVIDVAMPIIQRYISVISNADVSRNIHTFPKAMTYVAPCDYKDEEGECSKGEMPDGSKCPKCKGTGKKKTESPLDTLEVDFPDDITTIFDINKLSSYANQSTVIVEFLDKLEQRLERRIFASIFNAEMTPHSTLSAVGDTVTATEVATTRSDINDTLILTASMISKFKKWDIKLINSYLYPRDSSRILVNYEYPNDLKLSSVEELLSQLQLAKQSSAPFFVIEEITQNISAKLFDGDVKSMNKIALKKRFIPFFEMSTDFVLGGFEKNAINTEDLIVFYNQESIFVDLEEQNPSIYFLKPERQKEIVKAFIVEFIKNYNLKLSNQNGKETKL